MQVDGVRGAKAIVAGASERNARRGGCGRTQAASLAQSLEVDNPPCAASLSKLHQNHHSALFSSNEQTRNKTQLAQQCLTDSVLLLLVLSIPATTSNHPRQSCVLSLLSLLIFPSCMLLYQCSGNRRSSTPATLFGYGGGGGGGEGWGGGAVGGGRVSERSNKAEKVSSSSGHTFRGPRAKWPLQSTQSSRSQRAHSCASSVQKTLAHAFRDEKTWERTSI